MAKAKTVIIKGREYKILPTEFFDDLIQGIYTNYKEDSEGDKKIKYLTNLITSIQLFAISNRYYPKNILISRRVLQWLQVEYEVEPPPI